MTSNTSQVCTDAEARCTLPNQQVEAHGLETLPDGERDRYLDYDNPNFPGHWGKDDQGMKTATPKPQVVTGHCTGVVHTTSGVITSHATTAIKQASQPSTPPRYPC